MTAMTASWTTISPAAMHAIRAASCYNLWGRAAAFAYARRHGCTRLFVLARQLHVATINGF